MFSHLQDLNYLERQAFNRFSCLHPVLKKIFVPVIFIYLRGVSENIMPNNIINNYFLIFVIILYKTDVIVLYCD